jgi:peroxiredoxin
MKLDIKSLAILAIVVAAVGFLFLMPSKGGNEIPANTAIKTIDGQTVNLSSLKGKPYLLEFWSTTCPGCVKEIPHLIAVQQTFKAQGFAVVGVAMSYDQLDEIKAMQQAKSINYMVGYDQSGALAQQFNVRVTPTSFLVDANGKIVTQKMGEWQAGELEQKLQTLVKG